MSMSETNPSVGIIGAFRGALRSGGSVLECILHAQDRYHEDLQNAGVSEEDAVSMVHRANRRVE